MTTYVRPVKDIRKHPISAAYRKPGNWAAGYHPGVDIACPVGTPVYATIGGDVRTASRRHLWGSAFGTYVIINDDADGSDWAYCHLSRSVVKEGQKVKQGQLIGYSGNTGRTTGPHLHLERRPRRGRYGTDRNPNLWPNSGPGSDGPVTAAQKVTSTQTATAAATRKAYTYVTKYTSPNQSSGFDPTSITIHWWGEPRSHRAGRIAGPVSWLCNKAAKASAHFVVSGHDPDYGGPVSACIVALDKRAWHAGNGTGNRASVGIEMAPFDGSTPKATVDKHLEMAAMVVALVWHWAPKTRGKALRGHKSWKNTACPGNYMPHLDAIRKRAEQLYPLVDPDRPGYIRTTTTTTQTPTPTPPKEWDEMATKKEIQDAVKDIVAAEVWKVWGRTFRDYFRTGGKQQTSTASDALFTTSADVKSLQIEQNRQAAQLDRIEKALTPGGTK